MTDSGRSLRDSFCEQDWNQRPVLLGSFPPAPSSLSLCEGETDSPAAFWQWSVALVPRL